MKDSRTEEGSGPGRNRSIPIEESMRKLRAAIEDGRLPPGARLPEEKLARGLHTTRARVREVLARLAIDRLVDLKANRGAFVARPSIDEARYICEARLVVEKTMARLAASRATPEAIAAMRKLLREEQTAWQSDDIRPAVVLSRRFHSAVADAAANPVLAEMLNALLSRSALTQAVYAARGADGCLCEDHAALLNAIEAGDGDQAEEVMVTHVQNIISRLNLEPEPEEVDIENALRDNF